MFIFQRKAESGGRSVVDDFWYTSPIMFGGISRDTAIRLSTVYACIKVIAESCASLPLITYKRNPDGGKTRATDHPYYRTLSLKPNARQTRYEWIEQKIAQICLSGNAYDIPLFDRSGNLTLTPVDPNSAQVSETSNGALRYSFLNRLTGTHDVYADSEVLHYRALSLDGVLGVGPIQYERETIDNGRVLQTYSKAFFQNNGNPGGWIEYPSHFKDKEQRDSFRDAWQKSQTGGNFGKTALLEYGMKYHPATINNADAQFLDSRKYSDIEICRIFRVPPHKVANLERATFSNIEHQGLEFVTDTLMPWLIRIESVLNATLFQDSEDYFCEFLVDGIIRGDIKARYDAYNVGITAGFLTRNEAREKENMNRIDGLDDPLLPLNMQAVNEETLEPVDNAQEDEQEQQQGETDNTAMAYIDTVAEREKAMLESGGVNRFASMSEKTFCEWWDKRFSFVAGDLVRVLSISEQSAVEYLDSGKRQFTKIGAAELSGATEKWAQMRALELKSIYRSEKNVTRNQ